MLKDVNLLISTLSFIIIMSDRVDNSVDDELRLIINGKSNLDELSFDELIKIVKVLKKHILNAS